MKIRILVSAVVVAISAAACGVSTDSSPTSIPESSLPAGIASTTPTPEVVEESEGVDIAIYLLGENTLVPVPRTIPRPVGIQQVVEELIAAGDNTELTEELQLRSAIAPETEVLAVDIDETTGVLTINFGQSGFFDITDPNTRLQALAQIVYTTTGLASVQGVLIQLDGEPRGLPTETGTGEADGETPVTPADYPSFAPVAGG